MSLKANALLSAVVAAVVSIGMVIIFGDVAPEGQEEPSTQGIYSRILSSGTVRAGYYVGAPLLIIDPNTRKKSGIFYDVVTSAAARLRLDVDWSEEVGYGEMIQGLNDGRYDIIGSGVWINADRGRLADFTIPLYYDAVYAYAKVFDKRFQDDLSVLNSPDYIISTMDGELGATIAKTDFPLAKTLELPQGADFSQLILNVIAGKADIVFLAAAPARAYEAANPGQIAIVNPQKPLRIFPNAVMIPRGQYELRQALNHAIMEMMNSGEIDAILSMYEEVPDSFLRVASPFKPATAIR